MWMPKEVRRRRFNRLIYRISVAVWALGTGIVIWAVR